MVLDKYVPGACNIGPTEIARRQFFGFVGFLAALFLYGLLAYFSLPRVFRLLVFFPAMMSATGVIQARMRFCIYFGTHGCYNFGPEAGKTENVGEPKYRELDRKKSMELIACSAFIGLLVALLAYTL